MKWNCNQQLAKIYGDIFDFYVTDAEAKIWEIHNYDRHELVTNLHEYRSKSSLRERKERKEISGKKIKKVMGIAEKLKKIPTVVAIFLTGSVAVGNAKKESDIDLLIISKPGTLWLTRFLVFGHLKLFKSLRSLKDYKDKICPNIFLDANHLEIKEKNLYTAHEVLQAKCLFDRSNVNYLWLKKNAWAKDYLPNAYKYYVSSIKYYGQKIANPLYVILYTLYFIPELVAFILQIAYMKRKITNEKVGWGYAFFHPQNLSEKVMDQFENRLRNA